MLLFVFSLVWINYIFVYMLFIEKWKLKLKLKKKKLVICRVISLICKLIEIIIFNFEK